MAVNKVVRSNGTTLIDISDTTATEDDVAEGKIFYLADGTRAVGRKGGSTRKVIIPEQTITASSTYTEVSNYAEALVIGEQYICTVDGVEYGPYYGRDLYGSVAIGDYGTNGWLFEYDRNMYFTATNTSLYGSHTIKVEQES